MINTNKLIHLFVSKVLKYVKTVLLCYCFCALATQPLFAQSVVISGTVREGSESLPGVNVTIKGTTRGTITDIEGKYTIEVPDQNTVLTFSFVGYTTQEIMVGNQRMIHVTLSEDVQSIDEVVVVGYGTRRAGEVTGAVSTVKSADIERMSVINASEALRAAPGVSVIESNTPGADATVRVRGFGTINNNDPLWIVDGVPGGTVNPNNIESITILKDAAAQAIYGSRAANGVVLVTTKGGRKNQKPQVNISLKAGITKNTNRYDLLNTKEYGEMLWLQAKNDGITNFSHPLYGSGATPDIPDYIFPARGVNVDESKYDYLMDHEDGTDTYLITKANKEGTNWLKEAERNAQFRDFSIDVSGGSENTVYAFQLGYLKQDGILRWTGYDRYNLQSNVTSDVTKWLQVGEKLGITYSENYGNQDDNSETSIISWAYRMQPIVPVHDIAGNYAGTRVSGTGNSKNPIFLLDKNQWDKKRVLKTTGNVFAKVSVLDGLSAKTLFGVNYTSYHFKNIDYVEKGFSERGKYDNLYETGQFSMQWNWTNTIEYTKSLALHRFTVMAGTEAISYRFNEMKGDRYDYTFKDPNFIQLGSGVQGQKNDGYLKEWSLFSIFGRLNYSYADKYLFEGVIRRDGSSRFGGNNKYGVFPAFSAGWRLTSEDFMAFSENWLDMFKLRFGFGVTGNDQVGSDYNSYTQFGFHLNDSFYPLAGSNTTQGTTGYYQKTFGNEDVKWEQTRTTNLGFDATVFKRLNITFEVWQRRTTDMLYPKQIPNVLGQATAPSVNVGEMLNKGFDISVAYSGAAIRNELQYFVDVSLSRYKNEIVKLTGEKGEFIEGSEYREQIYTRSSQGVAFPEFYGYIVDGIFQNQEEVDAWPTAFGAEGTYNKPGHYMYRDVNGDGVINASDRTYIGSPHPKFVAGLSFNVTYKGFGLSGRFYGSYGNKLVNYVRRFIDFSQFAGGKSHDRLYNSWGSPYLSDNTKAKLPIAESNDTPSQVPSTAFVENASYLRLKNLRISYDLNRLINMKCNNLQVYVQATNLFTITKYTGLDPEVNVAGSDKTSGSNMGIDSGAWPTPRQFMIGVNVGF